MTIIFFVFFLAESAPLDVFKKILFEKKVDYKISRNNYFENVFSGQHFLSIFEKNISNNFFLEIL